MSGQLVGFKAEIVSKYEDNFENVLSWDKRLRVYGMPASEDSEAKIHWSLVLDDQYYELPLYLVRKVDSKYIDIYSIQAFNDTFRIVKG